MAALRAAADDHTPDEFIARVKVLTSELPTGDARAYFELAGAYDSHGFEKEAEPLYRQALATGLGPDRRRRAVIQLASTIRNLGKIDESVALLEAERNAGKDDLDDAVAAFLALALTDAGRGKEAVSIALGALAPHLKRYNRSLAEYAKALLGAAP